MAKIKLENSYSRVFELLPESRELLLRELCYRPKGYEYSDAYRKRRWDGNKHLYWKNNVYPTGLTNNVVEMISRMEERNGGIQIIDSRLRPESGPGLPFNGEDRDYQNIEDDCIDISRGIIEFATGSGKTTVAARIISKLDLDTLYIVPSKALLYQTADELSERLGIPIGRIGDGLFEYERITVATIQTLWSVVKRENHIQRSSVLAMMVRTKVLFIDEAHHLGADSFFQVVLGIDAYYKFGLTGTAFRGDESGILLHAATGKIIKRVTSSHLIREGVLAETTIRVYDINSSRYIGGSWQNVYSTGIVNCKERNDKILELVSEWQSEGKSTLIIVKAREHGRILNEMIPGSRYMHGGIESDVREEVKRQFKNKEVLVLIGTIYDEGVDMPTMDRLIIAAGGRSPNKALQRVGRAIRRSSDKSHAIVVDFNDIAHSTLYKHSQERLSVYRREPEFKIEEIRLEVECNVSSFRKYF